METVTALMFLALLFWLFYWPWQALCVDVSRQRIFTIRQELFDLAAHGRLDFQSSAYRDLRRMMNNTIRSAHRISWVEALTIWLLVGRRLKKYYGLPSQALKDIEDDAARNEASLLLGRLYLEIQMLMVKRSIPLLIMVTVLVAVTLFAPAAKALYGRWQRRIGERVVVESEIGAGASRRASFRAT